MMHHREKSHSAIVAAKPTDKAGANAAEPWSQGRGPRGTRASPGTGLGKRVPGAGGRRYDKPQGSVPGIGRACAS